MSTLTAPSPDKHTENLPIKVLLVEDDPDHQLLTEVVLSEGEEFELKIVGSVAEALELLSRFEFHALILDYHLPDGNGSDLWWKVTRGGLNLPTLFLTSLDSSETSAPLLNAGVMGYILKSEKAYTDLPNSLRAAIQQYPDTP